MKMYISAVSLEGSYLGCKMKNSDNREYRGFFGISWHFIPKSTLKCLWSDVNLCGVYEDNSCGEILQSIFVQGLYTWQNKITVFHPHICLSETLLSLCGTSSSGAGRSWMWAGIVWTPAPSNGASPRSLHVPKSFQILPNNVIMRPILLQMANFSLGGN